MKFYATISFFFLSFTTKATDVLTLIQESEIQYKNIASKVAILESNHFKSRLYKGGNNAFGFKRNSRKLYTHTKNGYCVYSSLKHSVQDYMLWERSMIKHHKLHTRSRFLAFLNRSYSKTANYASKVESIKIPEKKVSMDSLKSIRNFLSLQLPLNEETIEKKRGIIPFYSLNNFRHDS